MEIRDWRLEVGEALGRSVVYEEHRGDFAQARRIAEAALDEARRRGEPTALADAWLALGIVRLLQGGTQVAAECFQQVPRLVPQDPARRLRAAAYAHLTTYWHFNRFPDGNGASALEVDAQWNGVAYAQAEHPEWQTLFNAVQDTTLAYEAWLVHQTLCQLLPARSVLHGLRYTPPEGGTVDTRVQQMVAPLLTLRQAAVQDGLPPGFLAVLDWLASDLYHRANRPTEAAQLLGQAEALYAQAADPGGVALCRMTHGDRLVAPQSTPCVWGMTIAEGASEGCDLSWPVEADEFDTEGADPVAAAAAYDEAEALFRQANAPRGVAAVALRRGYLALLTNDWGAAVRHIRAAAEGFAAAGDEQALQLARVQEALARVGRGERPPDLETARAVGAWGATEGSFSYALGLGLLCTRLARHWLTRRGDYERAFDALALARDLFEALGAESNLAQVETEQGAVFQAIGDTDGAMAAFEKALARYPALPAARPAVVDRLRRRAMSLAARAYQLANAAMHPDAMEQSAQRIEAQLGEMPTAGGDVAALADVLHRGVQELLSGEELLSAFDPTDLALQQLGRSLVEQSHVLVPLYRARFAQQRGDEAEATRQFALAERAASEVSSGFRHFLRAQVLAYQGRYAEAMRTFEQYLKDGGADAGFVGHLTRLMQAVGGEQGRREAAMQQRRTLEQAFTFMVRVEAYDRARAYLEQLVALAGPDWWAGDARPWQPLSDIGEMYEGLADDDEALTWYERAVSALEERRAQLTRDELKTALGAGKGASYLYLQAARTALRTGEAARAFQTVERGKARALLDLMQAGLHLVQMGQAEEDKWLRRWREQHAAQALRRRLLALEYAAATPDAARIAAYEEALRQGGRDIADLEAILAERNPTWRALTATQAPVLSAAEVAAALPPDTLLLEYAWQGDDLLAFALTADGIQATHHARIPRGSLNRTLTAFWQACANRLPLAPHDADLSATLLLPFADAIRAARHLVIVPSGALHRLPFHVLPLDGAPLGLRHTVRYLPAAAALQFHQAWQLPREARLLAVGNPTHMQVRPLHEASPRPLAPLPYAGLEAQQVVTLFPNGSALIGDEATEEAVRSQVADADLLHLATHGVLEPDAPLLSAVALAHGEVLTVYELMGLRLRARLVVMSACQTALGEITGGDDVVGLARGLLAAGARAVVVSLWPVNDLSTSLLMVEFYRRLRAGDDPAHALQTAQVWLQGMEPEAVRSEIARLRESLERREMDQATLALVGGSQDVRDARRHGAPIASDDYGHPFYWAPFVLVG